MSAAPKFPEGWAIVGRRARFMRRSDRVLQFAGGRSRRKLQITARRMNASDGGYHVAVRWYGVPRKRSARLDRARAQRAARKARRRGEQ